MTLEESREFDNWAKEITEYHAPSKQQLDAIGAIRLGANLFLQAIARHCPPGPDRSAAIRKVREAMMTANAAIVVPDVKVPG